jgi:hypothetical protein
MNNFIDSLNLPLEGEMRGKQYIIDVNTSDEFSSLFVAISLNDSLRLDDTSSIATTDESKFRYTDGTYDVILSANYDENIYSLVVEER